MIQYLGVNPEAFDGQKVVLPRLNQTRQSCLAGHWFDLEINAYRTPLLLQKRSHFR